MAWRGGGRDGRRQRQSASVINRQKSRMAKIIARAASWHNKARGASRAHQRSSNRHGARANVLNSASASRGIIALSIINQ